MRSRCSTISTILLTLVFSLGTALAQEKEKPLNVVFILTDNHGAWTLGCYGNPDIRTPHIDKLAAEGARFTRAFCNNGVCSPTRATYLTGLMPSQHGVHNFLVGGRLQTGPESRNTLEEFRSLPEILRDRGYACGLVGKWHLGDNMHPQEGLDDYWITMPHGGTSTFHGAKIIENGEQRTEEEYLTSFWTQHAVQFLEQQAKGEKPFFLYLAYNGPYGLSRFQIEPLRGPRAKDYEDKDLPSFPGGVIHPWEYNNREYFGNPTAIRRYAAELSSIDDGVGTVMETLERLGVAENTLVVFAADQGWAGGQHGFWGMGDHTRPLNAFEYSMQIPMIFHHPKGIPAGQTPEVMVSNYDFLPSVLGYLDMSEELPTAPASPGRDFSPVLRGGDVPDWENAVFYEHETLRCVRTERWKLIERFEDGYDELYNLEQDPGELVNLYGREEVASVQKELESRLDTFFRKNVLAKYDLWNGGGSQTRLFDFGEEAKEREEARIATGLAPTAYDLSFNPPPFDLPKGYVAEVVAAPPLVEHPMMVSFDDRGRLFVAEASGVNLNKSELETALPNYVRLLEDTNNDGFYDKTSIFADNMTFPQGTLWLNGALYVASPPGIWKLVDHDDDGVADERIEIATGFDYTGNAADVHGPFLHPNGRIYWCHGRKGHEVHQADGEVVSANKGARIWSCKPDGSDIRVHAGGGMDNPVEITFTPEGEIIGSVNLFYGRPRGDVLVHWVLGGRYPRYDQGAVLEEFKSTGDPLTEIYNFGHVAVSGMTRTSDASIYTTLFNTQEVHKSTLQKSGSTYTASTEPFLKIRNPDVHLTDVMEDADGSLLVVDTGGWFRIGCPTSQLAKPEIPGAIYRIRKAGPDDWKTDWYGKTVNWAEASPKQLTDMLTDKRAAVRDRAVQELALRGDDAVAALGETLKSGEESAQIQAVWALTRIGTKDALQQIRGALKSENPALAMTACNSVIATRDPEAVAELIGLVTRPEADLRRTALTALGATGSAQGIPAIIGALENPEDRFLEHAAMYALIQLDQYEATRKAMPKSAAAQRRVYWALDQMDSSKLAAKDILTLLEEEELQETATAIAARHPEWAPEFASHFEAALAQPEKAQVLETLAAVGPSMVGEERMQAFVGKALGRDAAVKSVALEVIAESPTSLPLVESWKPAFSNLLANATGEELNQALKAVARLDSKAFGKELDAIAARDELPVRTRFLALRALQAGDTVNATGFALLLEMLKPDAAPADRAEAVALLSKVRLTKPQLLDLARHVKTASPVDFAPMLGAFSRMRDAEVGEALSAAVAEAPASASMPATELRRHLSRFPAESVATAQERIESLEQAEQKRIAQLEALVPRVQAEGDAERGRQVFQTGLGTCIMCHQIGEMGKDVGPNLTTIGRIREPRDLLESILFPGASIARDFEAYLITMKDGGVHSGVIREENNQVLKLATVGGLTVEVERAAVASMKAAPASLMPMGLDQTLTEQQLLDLVAYLDSLE